MMKFPSTNTGAIRSKKRSWISKKSFCYQNASCPPHGHWRTRRSRTTVECTPWGNWLRQIGCHRGTIVGQVFTRCALGWQSSDPSAHPRADPFSRRIEPSDHVRSRPIDSRCAFDSDKSKASPSGYKHLGTFGTCLMPSMTRRYNCAQQI